MVPSCPPHLGLAACVESDINGPSEMTKVRSAGDNCCSPLRPTTIALLQSNSAAGEQFFGAARQPLSKTDGGAPLTGVVEHALVHELG